MLAMATTASTATPATTTTTTTTSSGYSVFVLCLLFFVKQWAQAVLHETNQNTRNWPWTPHAATNANGRKRPNANGRRLRPDDAPTLPRVLDDL